jgi:hypothetical protein
MRITIRFSRFSLRPGLSDPSGRTAFTIYFRPAISGTGDNVWNKNRRTRKKIHSFSFYLLFSMIVLVMYIVGFLTINDYLYTKDNFDPGFLQEKRRKYSRPGMTREPATGFSW